MSKLLAFILLWVLMVSIQKTETYDQKSKCLFQDCTCFFYKGFNKEFPSVNVMCYLKDLKDFSKRYIQEPNHSPIHVQITVEIIKNGTSSINEIPDDAFNGIEVERIILSKNQIQTINKNAFRGVSGVKSLNFYNNIIKDLSENAFKPLFSSLQVLDLKFNKLGMANISHLNAVLRQFVELVELNLLFNLLNEAPNLSNNKKLKILDLTANNISSLDPPFHDTQLLPDSLEFIDLGYNQFTSVKENWFSHLTNLETLHLECNYITSIDAKAFKSAKKLKFLGLYNNSLKDIPSHVLPYSPALQRLSLGNQQPPIKVIRNYAFDKNIEYAYYTIDLSENSIEEIEPKAFCSSHSPYHIDFSEIIIKFNPLSAFDVCPLYLHVMQYPFSIMRIRLINVKCDPGLLKLLASRHCSGCFLISPCVNEKGLKIDTRSYLSMISNETVPSCSNPIYNCSIDKSTTLHPITTIPLISSTTSIPSIITNIPSTTNTQSSHKQIINEPLNASSCIFEDCDCDSTDDTLIIECKNSIYSFPQVSHSSYTNKSIDLFKLLTHEDSFREIPDNAFQNLNIRAIDLSNNGIKDVSRNAFYNLFGLSILDISINTIKELHENVFLPIQSTLKVMNIGGNQLGYMDISRLSNILKNLSQLQELYLENNGLKIVPDLSNNKQLNELKLENNHISTLDPSGGVLFLLPESLISIDLQNNDLTSIEENWFTHLKNIKTIDLSRNKITTVNVKAFNNLAYLEELDLSFNDIKQLPSRAFLNLPSIKTVRFSSQKSIKYIGNYAFDKISKTNLFYEQIDLFGNSIEYLKPRAFCSRFYRKSINVASLKLEFSKNATIDACALYQIENRNGSKTKLSLKNLKCDCYISQLGNRFDVEGSCYDNNSLIPINQYVCSVRNVVCDQLC